MALSKLAANSFDLTDNYALTGTVTGAVSTQKLFLIKNLDASSSSTLSFVDGSSSVDLDNTYKTYYFKFINIHPASDNVEFQWNGSTDTGSNYNVTKTTTIFNANHFENDSAASVSYDSGADIAQGTGFSRISRNLGNGSDESTSGELWMFNPSDTTFVTQFFSRTSGYDRNNIIYDLYSAGYFNTTSAIDAVQFKMASGNIDSGRIALYGIK
jgi:hypothetical protein